MRNIEFIFDDKHRDYYTYLTWKQKLMLLFGKRVSINFCPNEWIHIQ